MEFNFFALLNHFLEQALAVSIYLFTTIEGWAFVLSLIYVVFSIYKHVLAWVFAVLAAAVYGVACWQNQLYPTLLLQIFFIFMAMYGYFSWKKTASTAKIDDTLINNELGYWQHLLLLAGCFVLFDAIRYGFKVSGMEYQNTLEVFAVAASLIAQYMQARVYIQSWLWWIVINLMYIYINADAQLYLMSGLYAILTLLSIHGYYTWHKQVRLDGKLDGKLNGKLAGKHVPDEML